MKQPKLLPNDTLENALTSRGLSVGCLWQAEKPCEGTAWLEALMVNGGHIIIVQTFDANARGFAGWDAYLQCKTHKTADTIAEVLNWCNLNPEADA